MRVGSCLLLGFMLMTFGCGKKEQKQMPVPESEYTTEPVPPGHVKIIGTVVKIFPPEGQTSQEEICARFPCKVSVRIDSVLGYGSRAVGPLAQGDTLQVLFKLTVEPTQEILPDVQPPLPGLKEGERFVAVLESRAPEMGGKVSEPLLIGYRYEKVPHP